MMRNIGTTDRIIRLATAAVLAGLYATGIISGTTAVILLALAAVFVLTSLSGICPLYLLFGIRTRPRD